MKIKFLIICLGLIFLVSCREKGDAKNNKSRPSDIVSAEEMKNIFVDIFIAEGATGIMEANSGDINYCAKRHYNYVLKKHNINNGQFWKNYNYYVSDNDEMEKIMTGVIDILSQKQSKASNPSPEFRNTKNRKWLRFKDSVKN